MTLILDDTLADLRLVSCLGYAASDKERLKSVLQQGLRRHKTAI